MKRVLTALVACFPLWAAAADEIRISMEGKDPPFEEIDEKGQLKGFNVDIANALCAQMKAKCRFVVFPWDDQIPNLLAKKSDAILASMSITEERKKLVAFSDRYMRTPNFFVARRKTIPYVYITPKRLVGKKIGVQADTTQDAYLTAVYAGHSTIKRYTSNPDVYDALVKGEVDLGMFDAAAVHFAFLNTPRGKDFELVGSAMTDTKYLGEGAGIAFRKEDRELRERFNKALHEILENGVYQETQRKYFIFNVY
ncbi:transporter substrate-binding domain-containing protein [Chitinimonas lacunae]|uniref:Transporter substrate-binding domain-containing protein n=1 Tax=Chitinimonas lacunae TaxID=1963018 RepID=A0ABV8MLJ6_9NEIS